MTPAATRPKAILFDLDATLFDRESAVRELARTQYEHFAEDLSHVTPEAYLARVLELDGHGYVERTVLYQQAAEEFGLPAGMAERLTADFWARYGSFQECFPEVPAILARLRADGFLLGIITNGATRVQEEKILGLGLDALVDRVLISEREGMRKPDRRIFERALAPWNLDPAEAWYVGDHPVTDVQGAFAAGLTAVWRYTPYWPRPDVPCHEIRSLGEIPTLLQAL